MGSFRSKEDDVSKISTLIFVTNFPDSFSAKYLFHLCKQYGHVVDSFIPTKRTKDDKHFGFVRFINVFNVEILVNNLCTILVGRSKFHANVARFKREYMKGSVNVDKTKNESNKRKFDGSHKNVENTVIGKSFVSVVKTSRMPIDKESPPAIVLEDDCLNAKDLTLSLMGRVKEMASLVNLKKALCNEGFDVVKISYLGELWVLLEFETAKAKDSFRGNVGVGSWFSVIKQAYAEFVPEGRLVWVELDGVPFKFWSGPTFKRIAAKWGELLDVDDYDESNLHSKRICILSKVCEHIHESFKIVFRGKVYWVRASEVLGWTPEFSEEEEEDELSVEDNNDGRINDLEANNGIDESDVEEVLETLFDQPDDQKDKHSEDPFGLYPLLNKENIELARKVTEEDHSLSHPPGFTPEEGLNEGNTVNLDMKDYGENERDDNSFVNLEDGKDNSESADLYLTEKELHQLHLDEEALRETLEEQAMDAKARDEKIRQKQADDDEFFLKFRMRELSFVDELIDKGMGSSEVVQNRLEILNKIHQVQKNQASEISQKAKIKWAIEGDENVKFFHGILNKKRSQSQIRGVMANEDLEQDITKEEVKRAVWDCGVDKSPGPDGFSFYFYRHFWSMIEDDVFGAVEYFFINGLPSIKLLFGSLYKIIAKLLANRLVGVLSNLINEVQSAFVADRQILDGPFILNEVLQWCRKKRKHALIFKVDFEKAYDSVRWDFLDDVLDKFGFGVKWRNWIQSCLRSSMGVVLNKESN
ncbi:nucleotide-binding alpha-beta plait domain-containing protein [Tanacetum coccineum]